MLTFTAEKIYDDVSCAHFYNSSFLYSAILRWRVESLRLIHMFQFSAGLP